MRMCGTVAVAPVRPLTDIEHTLKNYRAISVAERRTATDYVASGFLFMYVLVQSYIYMNAPGYIFTIATQLAGIATFLLFLQANLLKRSWVILTLGFVFFTILSSLMISRGSVGIGNVASVIANAGIAVLILRRNILTAVLLVWVLLIAGYYIFLMAQGVPAGLAHASGFSRNAVSVHILFVVATYYAAAFIKGRTVTVLPAFLACAISIWAMGRGGLVSSIFLLGGIVLWKLFTERRFSYRSLAIFIAVLLTGVFVSVRPLVEGAREAVNLDATLRDISSRSDFLGGRREPYIDLAFNTHPFNLLFGEDTGASIVAAELRGNAHNSFLGLWQLTGIWALLVLGLWLYANIKFLFHLPLLGVVMTAVLLRAVVEHILWFSVFDYLFFLFVFFCFDRRALWRTSGRVASPLTA